MIPSVALLDVDGTLVDSNAAHAQAWVDAFTEFGYEVSFERARELIGKGGDKLIPEAIGIEKDSTLGKEIAEWRGKRFKKTYLPSLRAFLKARELLEGMKSRGLALVVATSAQPRELEGLLHVAGLEGLIEASATSGDAEDSKPDPDIVVAALKRAGCAPHEALMLGDTPYDVAAARKAGVRAVALRCGGWGDESFGSAIAIYDDPADLLARLDESPFFAD